MLTGSELVVKRQPESIKTNSMESVKGKETGIGEFTENIKKEIKRPDVEKAKSATFEALIEENKDKEFKNEHGYVNRVGNSVAKGVYSNIKSGLDTVVYPELWIKFYEERIGSVEILVMLRFVMMSLHANHAEAY